MDNVQLTTAILATSRASPRRGVCVRFNWVPSHVGLRGNEAANEAAGRPPDPPAVALGLSCPAYIGLRYGQESAAFVPQGNRSPAVQTSRQANLAQTGHGNKTSRWPLAQQLSRPDEVVLHRLRLGYGTLEELRDGSEDRPCEHCPHLAHLPLAHYLLAPLRRGSDSASARWRKRPPSCCSRFRKTCPLLPPPDGGGACRPTPPMNTKERE
ncbi:hypothetical protein GWK47_021702 [Chionoecetes opilio]|uniref:RNase H type-1 domain-containing protein n=1 Tax=Chionoecetes opilio TaxID=41210 RepID=A0A8J5CHR2_CHIOP|nr:hypothetical protein GWK47_021702 [Chionoecetes opilio]